MRIAYVEDNPTNLALVERVARMTQHSVVSYTEGEIALQELAHEPFDLILMDVELAGEISGLHVVRKLREGGLKTPIVAVTAYAMMGDREKCMQAGCNDYLPKPLPISEFITLLAKYDTLLHQPVPAENYLLAPSESGQPVNAGTAQPSTFQPSTAQPLSAEPALPVAPPYRRKTRRFDEIPAEAQDVSNSASPTEAPAQPVATDKVATPKSEPPVSAATATPVTEISKDSPVVAANSVPEVKTPAPTPTAETEKVSSSAAPNAMPEAKVTPPSSEVSKEGFATSTANTILAPKPATTPEPAAPMPVHQPEGVTTPAQGTTEAKASSSTPAPVTETSTGNSIINSNNAAPTPKPVSAPDSTGTQAAGSEKK